jgi:hypothetical protein
MQQELVWIWYFKWLSVSALYSFTLLIYANVHGLRFFSGFKADHKPANFSTRKIPQWNVGQPATTNEKVYSWALAIISSNRNGLVTTSVYHIIVFITIM